MLSVDRSLSHTCLQECNRASLRVQTLSRCCFVGGGSVAHYYDRYLEMVGWDIVCEGPGMTQGFSRESPGTHTQSLQELTRFPSQSHTLSSPPFGSK